MKRNEPTFLSLFLPGVSTPITPQKLLSTLEKRPKSSGHKNGCTSTAATELVAYNLIEVKAACYKTGSYWTTKVKVVPRFHKLPSKKVLFERSSDVERSKTVAERREVITFAISPHILTQIINAYGHFVQLCFIKIPVGSRETENLRLTPLYLHGVTFCYNFVLITSKGLCT